MKDKLYTALLTAIFWTVGPSRTAVRIMAWVETAAVRAYDRATLRLAILGYRVGLSPHWVLTGERPATLRGLRVLSAKMRDGSPDAPHRPEPRRPHE